MSKRREIFKDAGIYTISSYIAQAFDMVNGVLLRRFLGPSSMGVWTFLQVIQNYAKHSSLGITTATARDVPYFREKGDASKVQEIKNLVFTFTTLTGSLTALAIVFYAVLNKTRFAADMYYGLFAVAALILIQRIYNLFIVLLRAHKEFVFVGGLNIISSALSVIFTVGLTWKFKLYGFYAAMILNYLVTIAWILARTSYRFSFSWNWKGLKSLLSLGAAVLIADILRSILVSIDRLVITKHLGFEALGIYSVGLMADNYLYSVPNMLAVIFFPHFQEAFAKRDNPDDLKKYLQEPTVGLCYFFPLLIGFVWCSSDWLVGLFLPQYTEGIPALKMLTLGALFLSFTHSFSTFLITVRKHWLLIPINGLAVGFGFLINHFVIKGGGGIVSVAAAEGIISIFYFLLLSGASFWILKAWGAAARLYLKVFFLSLYFTAGLFGSDFLLASWEGNFVKFLSQFTFFMVWMIPILWSGERETGILSTLKQMAAGAMQKRIREN